MKTFCIYFGNTISMLALARHLQVTHEKNFSRPGRHWLVIIACFLVVSWIPQQTAAFDLGFYGDNNTAPMDEVCRIVTSSKRISGVSLWQFCDCRTYSSNRALMRPRTFNGKGLFDEYRRPKLACATVAGIFQAAALPDATSNLMSRKS